ncbi:hypothetical protein BG20_I0172 [Candidatus Nitrosarchaeum limnium BG20]|uniref:Uncharacterized protein n=1 Tax=Candidatus Nitrosarchaeum limnium BG20 TaxID=859192 RepID=S2E1W5_9ARCH|nr:hypothetical protein BG20_I0172 [Candidatus Nitrosarchaeum limnium BG20]
MKIPRIFGMVKLSLEGEKVYKYLKSILIKRIFDIKKFNLSLR